MLKNVSVFLICIIISFVPSLTAVIAKPGDWYAGLNKPPLNPPGWIFGPVWTLLYFLMGVSLYLFVRAHNPAYYRVGLIFFGIQLCLNFCWTLLFFGLKNPLLGLLDIVAMVIAVAITIWIFWNASHTASLLLVPYLCWVSFATYLNTGLLMLNR